MNYAEDNNRLSFSIENSYPVYKNILCERKEYVSAR